MCFNIPVITVRLNIKSLEDDYEKSENDIKALQSVGQIVGEVTRQLDEERCGLIRQATYAFQGHKSIQQD